MEFDLPKTIGSLVVIIALGTIAMFVLPEVTPMAPMTTTTIVMMVVPSMAIYGLVVLAIGVKHGEYRATH